MRADVLHGDCLHVMPTLHTACIDAIVTDPPYGLSFMGKDWDHGVPGSHFWREAWRVAKPGAYLLAFGGTRTYHRLTAAIEDAGWEIRDCLSWLYGSGFPKSHDVSKALDKAAGHWRGRAGAVKIETQPAKGTEYERSDKGDAITPAAAAAACGWGTALKPAWEPIILARKPLSGTVAANWLEHGTGALNIDACRVDYVSEADKESATPQGKCTSKDSGAIGAEPDVGRGMSRVDFERPEQLGRWPANVVLDEEAAALLDQQAPEAGASLQRPASAPGIYRRDNKVYGADTRESSPFGIDARSGASRFFYTAKASRGEREAGLREAGLREAVTNADTPPGTQGATNPRAGAGRSGFFRNNHPTVKPLDLMQWLCRLVTPKGGLILDPFCGSGTTGRAAIAEGFQFIGIEKEAEYVEIARARIAEYAPLFQQAAND